MARIRTIKPEFFTHEDLFDLEQKSKLPIRLAFAGLWTCCDRKGRFKWRPRQLKVSILPYDECDFSRVLDALATRGFVVKYASGTDVFGYIPSWNEHQFINNKEPDSQIPEPQENECVDACVTRESDDDDALGTRGVKEGKEGKEGKTREARDVFVLPDWIDLKLWKSFEEMRQRLRKPMTDDGRRLAVKKLESLRTEGHSPQSVIENSVMNSYQGLFPPGANSKPHEMPPVKPVTLAEKHARQVAQA